MVCFSLMRGFNVRHYFTAPNFHVYALLDIDPVVFYLFIFLNYPTDFIRTNATNIPSICRIASSLERSLDYHSIRTSTMRKIQKKPSKFSI